MRPALHVFLLLAAASPANAEEVLNGSAITALLYDRSLYGMESGAPVEQIFQVNGLTFYLANGASSSGNWEVRGNSYCSVWPPNPTWSCYEVLADGESVIFVAKDGKRSHMSKSDHAMPK